MLFSELGLTPALLKSLEVAGYTTATPIQAQAIPTIIAGKDLLGVAQTGTGKTAAFALPSLQRVSEMKTASGTNKSVIRCLILVPTRELALQVNTSFNKYGRGGLGGPDGIGVPLRYTVVFGGVAQFRQVESIRSGVDILVATPGRLMDLQNQRHLDLSNVELLILDEADQMLDMGFIVPIRRIAQTLRKERQTLMFSATMPREIKQLASEMLKKGYTEVSVAPAGTAADLVTQQAYIVDREQKGFLLRHFLKEQAAFKTLVFTRTKHGADRVARGLEKSGVRAAAIHGNRSQPQRTRALEAFKKGDIDVLVATDVAARGLHISDISHVINFDMPEVPDTYIHRIGRTARAGATGIAVSFVDKDDRNKLRAVERLIKKQVEILPLPTIAGGGPNEELPDDGFDDDAPRERSSGQRNTSTRGNAPRNRDSGASSSYRGHVGGRDTPRAPRDNDRAPHRDDRAPQRDDRAPQRDERAPQRDDRAPRSAGPGEDRPRSHHAKPAKPPAVTPPARASAFAPKHAPAPHTAALRTPPTDKPDVTVHRAKPAYAPKPHSGANPPHAGKPGHTPAKPAFNPDKKFGPKPGTGVKKFAPGGGSGGPRPFSNDRRSGPAAGKRSSFKRDR